MPSSGSWKTCASPPLTRSSTTRSSIWLRSGLRNGRRNSKTSSQSFVRTLTKQASRPPSTDDRSITTRSIKRWWYGAGISLTSTTSPVCASLSTLHAIVTQPSVSCTCDGTLFRVGLRTTSRCPSTTCTSLCTPRCWGRAASRSSCKSALTRCTGALSMVWQPTGSIRKTPMLSVGGFSLTAQIFRGCSLSTSGPRRNLIPASSWTRCASRLTLARCMSLPPRAML